MEFETVPRFFVLQWIEKYLFQWGFSDATADLITFLAVSYTHLTLPTKA